MCVSGIEAVTHVRRIMPICADGVLPAKHALQVHHVPPQLAIERREGNNLADFRPRSERETPRSGDLCSESTQNGE